MAITRFGYEPKRGFKNDDSDESDTESDVDSESFDYRKSKPDLDLNLLGGIDLMDSVSVSLSRACMEKQAE